MRLMMAGYEAMQKQIPLSMLAQYNLGALVSFWILKGKRQFEYPLAGNPPVVIDSGAYTLQQPDKICTRAQLRAYLAKYIEHLDKNAGRFLWAADLDVEFSFGLKTAYECLEALTKSGHPICPVWHPERGIPAWKDLCEKYEYVGMATQEVKKRGSMTVDQFRQMAYYAQMKGCKLHVMACTDLNLLLQVPCYTADSTSWLGFQRWTYLFDLDLPRGKSAILLKGEKQMPQNPVVEAKIRNVRHRKGTLQEQGLEIMPYTLQAISEIQAHVTRTWARRGVTYDE